MNTAGYKKMDNVLKLEKWNDFWYPEILLQVCCMIPFITIVGVYPTLHH